MNDETRTIINMDSPQICRICEEEGTFELNTNKFQINDSEILLVTAFNCFSSIDNVSWLLQELHSFIQAGTLISH